MSLSEEEWVEVASETQRLVDTQMRGQIREGQLSAILSSLPNQISTALSEEQTQLVSKWAGSLIEPNTFLDAERTEQARQDAQEAIPPIEVTYEADQIVVREGEIVTSEHVEALEALGLQAPVRSSGRIAAMMLFVFTLVLVWTLYFYRVHPEHWTNPRVMGITTALLVALTLGARIIMPEHPLLTYLYPMPVAAMLLGVLLSVDIAMLVTVMLSLIVGLLTGSIELVTYTFAGGMVASLVLWRVERLGAFVWTGALVGLTNASVVVTFALLNGSEAWMNVAARAGMALLNGATSASLALVGFYVLSNFLGITTFLQLMELARPTHPLFRELLLQAPGTYHHTIVVSNLAERAAEAVGADMLLVRVGAYYHDIGKMKNPHYFVENQADGANLHDSLDDPYKSAEIIIGHVREGMRLARKHKLPRQIADFIPEHHGTTCVAWFYHKAC
ncbi:MAG: HD family phosphohydrolase, partial [Ardenticatenaceae bacterium]